MFGRSFGVHWRLLAFCLTLLQAHAGVAMQGNPAALSPETAKIRDQVNDLPVGGKLTVRKIDGTEYHGNLQAIDGATFSIREVDLKQIVTLRYDEVARVSKNYGGKGIGGRRVNPRRSLIIGLIVVGGLIALAVAAVAADKP
jgi:hypothetical protein